MGGGGKLWITSPPLYPPLAWDTPPPTLRGIPPPYLSECQKGGIIPLIARRKFLGKNDPFPKEKYISHFTYCGGFTLQIIKRLEIYFQNTTPIF